MANIAYIDGQNLHTSTAKSGSRWHVDLHRFRVYLERKMAVDVAYYYLGYVQQGERAKELYATIQKAGFILVFRQHSDQMLSKKKGNVDTEIIFSIMKSLYRREKFDQVVLVSGDGDYKPMVDFLIEEGRFAKILFPNRKYRSSLYRGLSSGFTLYLDDAGVKAKIEQKRRGLLR